MNLAQLPHEVRYLHFSQLDPLSDTPRLEDAILFQHPWVWGFETGHCLWLSYQVLEHAGALGAAQIHCLLQALDALEKQASNPKPWVWLMDSAGAHLQEPVTSLHGINTLIERLIPYRRQPVLFVIPQGLFGGAAVLATTCSQHILLAPQASISLLGPKTLAAPEKVLLPGPQVKSNPPCQRLQEATPNAFFQAVLEIITKKEKKAKRT